jgi:DMSO reductase family type II enzyme chaperone
MNNQPNSEKRDQRFCNDDLRSSEKTAIQRSQGYELFSLLLSSPHDLDTKSKLNGIPITSDLPYSLDLSDLLNEFISRDMVELKKQYSGLFEVGNDGPPAPIREDLFLLQPAGLREDLIRFYDYFGYTLGEKYQWQMDHLSIELEFMYFLCFQEHNITEDRLSYQLSQLDFSTRHLNNWIPNFQKTLGRISSDALYTKIVVELSKFIENDIEWQLGTIDAL